MIFISTLAFYLTISFSIGVVFAYQIAIDDFDYKEMKLWYVIISIIFFIGTVLGILIGRLIVKTNKTFMKTNIYKILNKKPFRR